MYNLLMARAIIIIYISKYIVCANGPRQLLKTSNFYIICHKCDMQKTVWEWVHHPLYGSLKVNVPGSFAFRRYQIAMPPRGCMQYNTQFSDVH